MLKSTNLEMKRKKLIRGLTLITLLCLSLGFSTASTITNSNAESASDSTKNKTSVTERVKKDLPGFEIGYNNISEEERSTQVTPDQERSDWLVSSSPYFNGASTSLGAPVEDMSPDYPIQEFNPAAIRPNSLDMYNPMLQGYIQDAYKVIEHTQRSLIDSSRATINALARVKKSDAEYRIAKVSFDRFIFDLTVTGTTSILSGDDPEALREISTVEYLIAKKKMKEEVALNKLKSAELNMHALEDNYNLLKTRYLTQRNWLNLLLSINSDVGTSSVSNSTLKFLLNSYWEGGTASKCYCSAVLNFSTPSYSDLKIMENFAKDLGLRTELYQSMFIEVNGKSMEAISSPFGLEMNNLPSKNSFSVSGLYKVSTPLPKDGVFRVREGLVNVNYPKKSDPNLGSVPRGAPLKGVKELRGFSILKEESSYGPDSILLNYADFREVKTSLSLRSLYKISIIRGSGVGVDQNFTKNIWRLRSYADKLNLLEENLTWAPAYWDFLPSHIASSLVGSISYKLTDGSRVDMDRPTSVGIFTIPILKEVNCSVFMEQALSSAFLVIKFYGLSSLIDTKDYGGCYSAKKIEGNSSLSYHARGMAVDINVHQNLMFSEGEQDYRVVEILDRFGLRWGGYWNRKDPMHFELASMIDPLSRYNTL